jgi:hypothetical protein
VLVEQQPDQQGERVPAQQFVCGVVLGDAEVGAPQIVPRPRPSMSRRTRDRRRCSADGRGDLECFALS